MKKILLMAFITLTLTFSSGMNLINASEDTIKKDPEMIKVSETVEGSDSAAEIDKMMKPDELIKEEQEMAPEIETLEESGEKIQDKMK